LGKIAVEFEARTDPLRDKDKQSQLVKRRLVRGDGWSVSDVVCNAGPAIRPTEEQHAGFCIAIVRAGSFQYQSSAGRELMTPGSLMLGSPGQYFACSHEHAVGDRCISFTYEPEYIEALTAEARFRPRSDRFSSLRVPPVRELSSVIARACACVLQSNKVSPRRQPSQEQASIWEEIAIELALGAFAYANGACSLSSPAAEARVTRAVRMIESRPGARHELGILAQEAKLSRYHFLRIFRQLTALTPHQYVMRSRLRNAATRLLSEPCSIIDLALDSGFGDISNFNHAFRTEFAMSPRSYRDRSRNFKAASFASRPETYHAIPPVRGDPY
jgi:AraC family transcriptional regulator